MNILPNGYDMKELVKNTDSDTLRDYQYYIKKEIEKRTNGALENHLLRITTSIQNAINDDFEIYYCINGNLPIVINDISNIYMASKYNND